MKRKLEKSQTIDSLETEIEDTLKLMKRRKEINKEFSKLNPYGGYISLENFTRRMIGPYKLAKNLGSGSSCKVKLGLGFNGEKVAIKIITRTEKNKKRIYREIIFSTLLNHPNLVKLKAFYYNELHFFLVFEYIEGKLLLDIITEEGAMDEIKARRYFRQLVSAMNYLHRNFVVHRDLKIENIFVDRNGNIRIIDFGLSNFYDTQYFLNTFCGSLYFAAPELLNGKEYIGPEIDIWSLGVVLYVMLCGTVPFEDSNIHDLHQKIKNANFSINKYLSSDAQNLLKKMINPDPLSGISTNEIIEDKWTNKGYNVKVYENLRFNYKIEYNKTYINFLSNLLSFQFPNFKTEIKKYIQMQNKIENPSIGFSKPCVSIYFLFSDLNINLKILKTLSTDENFHLLTKLCNNQKFYNRVFADKKYELPKIKNTILKGFFNTKSTKELCILVIKFFENRNIKYWVEDSNFLCEVKDYNGICRFKLSIYYNVVMAKYFLSTKFIDGDNLLFLNVKQLIRDMIIQEA